jgi:hypothetical protein
VEERLGFGIEEIGIQEMRAELLSSSRSLVVSMGLTR